MEILRAKDERRANLLELRDLIDKDISNKTPTPQGRDVLGGSTGIDREAQKLLLNVVMQKNPQNPWTGEFIRARNQLIINSLLALGIRRSELLGLRTTDLDPRTQEVLILRRPDDVSDPRLSEPNAKTRDRALPISSELYSLISKYLILRHKKVRGAHSFLIVSNTGNPLSKSELNRIFRSFDKIQNLPKLTPHILRHTFCENLADDLHTSGHTDAQILTYLRRLGGWSDTSNTPLRYIKRFVQEQSANAAKAMQQRLFTKVFRQDQA